MTKKWIGNQLTLTLVNIVNNVEGGTEEDAENIEEKSEVKAEYTLK